MAKSMVELVEDIVVLLFLELKRGVLEIKHNILSIEKGAAMIVVGAGLLFFALITYTATAVAVLALFLPIWLSALLVALSLTFFGVAFFFSGLGHFKNFTLVPSETIHRVENIFHEYRKVSALHHAREERIDPDATRRRPGRGQAAQ